MKIELIIETIPQSFDAEDEISNTLQDGGLKRDLEAAIELAIAEMMHWRDLQITVRISA